MAKCKLNNIIKNIKPECVDCEWEGIKFKTKTYLSIEDSIRFSKTIVDICFTGDTREYTPELMSFAVNVATVLVYTDIVLPESVEDKYKVVMLTDLYPTICDKINHAQHEYLILSAEERIEHKLNIDVEFVKEQVDMLYHEAQTLFNKISEVFSDFSSDDFKTMLTAISEHKIDEGKIMEAYLSSKK